MKAKIFVVMFLAVFLVTGSASAYLITSSGDAAISGLGVIDFESQTAGTYTTLTIGNVTFTGTNGTFDITNAYNGSYNSVGQSNQNTWTGTDAYRIDFATSVNAFGFNFGASDDEWLLNAYYSANNLLESHILPETYASNAGEYYGIASTGISYATLTQTYNHWTPVDYIFIDNFSPGPGNAVPEPGTMLLLGSGLLGMIGIRRKK